MSIALQQRVKELEAQLSQLAFAVAEQDKRLAKVEQRKPGPKPKVK